MECEGSLPHTQVPATCPYPVPARSSPNPTSYFLKIHLNIILPSTSGSLRWSLSFRLPYQNPVYASPLPHTRYTPRPTHSSRFYVFFLDAFAKWRKQTFRFEMAAFMCVHTGRLDFSWNLIIDDFFSKKSREYSDFNDI